MRRFTPVFLVLLAAIVAGCIPLGLGPSGYGSISVTSDPPRAEVWLDGKDTGKLTPAVLEHVPAGRRTVELRFQGMQPVKQDVVVRASQQAAVDISLQPLGASSDPSAAVVHGFVEGSRAGSRVEGATVRAYVSGTSQEVASTVTDRDGAYGFSLLPGTYDIVATRDGYAESKRQSLEVRAGEDVQVDLILREATNSGWPLTAPTITVTYKREDGVYDLLEPGTVISGPTEVRVKVDAANAVYRIRAWVGHKHESPRESVSDVPELRFTVGDGDAPGETELIVDTYDLQLNWAELRIPILISGGALAVPPRVTGVDVTAHTLGVDLGLLSLPQSAAGEHAGLFGLAQSAAGDDGGLFWNEVPAQFAGTAALGPAALTPKNVTVLVDIRWRSIPDVVGYEIERAWSLQGPWQRIARLPGTGFGDTQHPYTDMSAELRPALKVYYRVRAIGPYDRAGEWSTPVWVTPLERFEVRLVSPPHNATGVPLNPVFRWEYDDIGAEEYIFRGYVRSVTVAPGGATFPWQFEDRNFTEAPFNYDGTALEVLQPAKMYTWGINWAVARETYAGNSRAYAYSGANDGAVGGEFLFTTGFYD